MPFGQPVLDTIATQPSRTTNTDIIRKGKKRTRVGAGWGGGGGEYKDKDYKT